MKKSIFTILFCLLLPIIAKAQFIDTTIFVKNGKVVIEKVIPLGPITPRTAQEAIRNYLLTNYKSTDVIRLLTDNEIMARVMTPILAAHSLKTWGVDAELSIDCRFKENRMKVVVACESMINKGRTTITKQYVYSPLEAAPFANPHPAKKINLMEEPALKAWNNLQYYMLRLHKELLVSILTELEEDNW